MEINSYLDSTLLRDASREEIRQLVSDAIRYKFKGVCIQPYWDYFVKSRLAGTGIKTVVVPNWLIGGGNMSMSETGAASCSYADEIDYIINVYMMYELKNWDVVEKELKTVRDLTKGTLKVIIESNYLRLRHPDEYKKLTKQAVRLIEKIGVQYIKTDSSLYKRSNIETLYEDVQYLKKITKLKVKAAGGVRTKEQCKRLIELGANRIGTSHAMKIVGGETE